MATAEVIGFALHGTQAVRTSCLAAAAPGLGEVAVSGLPDGEAARLGALVVRALGAAGLSLPRARLAVRLAPAPPPPARGIEAAVAVAALAALGVVPAEALRGVAVFGALGADGALLPAEGIAAVAIQARAQGLALIGPAAAEEGGVRGAADLIAVMNALRGPPLLAEEAAGAPAPRAGLLARLGTLIGGRSAPPPQGVPRFVPVMAEAPAAPPAPPRGEAARDPPFASTGPQGHRARMRERVLARGADSLADYELLEMLLFLAFKKGDTKPLAKAVINRFGSFAAVLSASEEELLATPGLGPHAVSAIMIVRNAAERLARAELSERPVLGEWERLVDYLTIMMARRRVEQLRVLFLDPRNRLLADEELGEGTVNMVPIFPREVVRRALALHATALILVHNHPSGDPEPSPQDIEMTNAVVDAVGTLGIVVHDHVIVGNGRVFSLRREGLL
jgi:DNA repair protein RadC